MCARGNRAYTCPRTIADPADCERQRRTPMTKILLATAVVALVAFATPASAQAVKNCSILHPAAAMVAEEVITWKLPSQTDGSAYTGPGDVFVWTTPERARIVLPTRPLMPCQRGSGEGVSIGRKDYSRIRSERTVPRASSFLLLFSHGYRGGR